ncbi:uncharacterized protein BJX67DRAFT_152350 [Aspergillus lucknowensis]|uniref:Tim44-like domain-containing protein n=1 Tax=Aspergillus lucknowensis TaxID=176173 RepID=A0ABR4LNL2_9EURO
MSPQILKRPLLSAARGRTTITPSYTSLFCSQCRQFSVSSQRTALQRGLPQTLSVRQPAQPSMKSRGMNLSRAELPQDIGLLPGTFIRPLWRDLPSIFQQPNERLRFEWLWLKSGFQNFASLVAYSKIQIKGLPLRLRERRQVARELHKRMYSAFANGDAATLRKICCSGLANNLIGRIAARNRGEKVTWSLDKYIRSPSTFLTGIRVVSDRATVIPELPDSGVRQVVLRITSRQSTGKTQQQTPAGKRPAESPLPRQQDCTEYIVIQKLRWMGEEEAWRIWGHATPTTLEDLSSPFFAPGLTLADRLEAMKEAMGTNK